MLIKDNKGCVTVDLINRPTVMMVSVHLMIESNDSWTRYLVGLKPLLKSHKSRLYPHTVSHGGCQRI